MSKTSLRRSNLEKERHWQELVRGQQRSGQSVREYCRQVGVKESAFYWWRRELAGRRAAREAARSRGPAQRKPSRSPDGRGGAGELGPQRKPGRGKAGAETPPGGGPTGNDASPFVPIQVLAGDAPAGVEIYLGEGRTIRVRPGFDRQTLCEVLAVLESRPC